MNFFEISNLRGKCRRIPSLNLSLSGPCRDRTDDPQIKSVSDEDESTPD